MSFISLSALDIGIAALLLVMNALLSVILRLGLARQMLIAATRMVIQLLLLGLVLKVLFDLASPLFTSAMGLIMILFAGREVMARQSRKLTGWWAYGLGTTAMLFAGTVVTLFALTTQVRPDPWYEARVALPLLGMILGNTMTGIALGLDRLLTSTVRERGSIEARLALGHTITEAMSGVTRDALRSGLMPIINSMSAVGLVSIPGMMTGQILAGIEPMEAVKYQLLIMFLIAGGTTLGVLGAVLAGGRRLTDNRHRLRLDRLSAENGD
ncbi:MAG: iron export ABC transporter permease subunit FetB [Rhodospirillales bacterium]|nr:iron export ABC transporter permease subunit FetB [Rhodospirillaceae bacterium]MDP6429006.1 iron export ABC transporter permease subunit FetB [Rhodospirillales bacterium]MDP6646727.1 iron export ABC transporter permease subunit FetB [Rhodospirillales bacterium]MDP6840584.1 iron export ABC transporter permease subunit FetB [Rhodospirillales bacterium]